MGGEGGVVVPKVFKEVTTEKVLTMDDFVISRPADSRFKVESTQGDTTTATAIGIAAVSVTSITSANAGEGADEGVDTTTAVISVAATTIVTATTIAATRPTAVGTSTGTGTSTSTSASTTRRLCSTTMARALRKPMMWKAPWRTLGC